MSGIYRAYDVRGIYPTDINQNIARLVARAAVFYLTAKQEPLKFTVGRDGRNSSPELCDTLTSELRSLGADIDYLDITTTDAFYWVVGSKNYPAGIMVTASHNPAEYNGFKMVGRGVSSVSGKQFEEIITSEEFKNWKPEASKSGELKKISPFAEFVESLLNVTGQVKGNFKIVADPGNGTANVILKEILPRLPVKAEIINGTIDGNFPGRGPDPMVGCGALCSKVVEVGADFGVAWDNDSDRILFVDETGKMVPGDITLALVAKKILEKIPGAAVVRDVISSKAVDELTIAAGGKAVPARVGHLFIKKAMIENNAPFGGEVSGHYYYHFTGENDWYADNTWLTLIGVLQILSEAGKKLSELVGVLSTYYKSDVITFKNIDALAVFKELKDKYKTAELTMLDGLTADFGDWWFNVRPSNTEPILKLVVEARTKEQLYEKVSELKTLIARHAS